MFEPKLPCLNGVSTPIFEPYLQCSSKHSEEDIQFGAYNKSPYNRKWAGGMYQETPKSL